MSGGWSARNPETNDMILITPHASNLVNLAKWATAQNPKVRTSGHDTFAVPAALFGDIPAYLLVGATVDGQPWVSPDPVLPNVGPELTVAEAEPLYPALDAIVPKTSTRRRRQAGR